ncbi:hypothetical protein Bca101_020163 [Brassica carinata]
MNSMMECISQQEAAHKATNDRLDVITNAITPPAADETEKTTLSDQSCCTSGSQPGTLIVAVFLLRLHRQSSLLLLPLDVINPSRPAPKLLRSKECEALRQAYGADMLLLDPKFLFSLLSFLYLLLFFTVKWGYVLSGGGDGNDVVKINDVSEVVKSHPGHQLSSSPPPYLKAALSASSESNYSVLLIICYSDMYIHSSLPKILQLSRKEKDNLLLGT